MFWFVLYSQITRRLDCRSPVAGARHDLDVAAVGVGLPVGHTGGRLPTTDDLVVAVGIQVGHRRGREHRIREPREALEHRTVRCPERQAFCPTEPASTP